MNLHTILRFGAAALVATSAAGFAACGDDDDAAPATATPRAATTPAKSATATTGNISVGDNSFAPASLTVKVGAPVRWTWSGSNPHSVVGTGDNSSKIPKSATQTGSGTYELSFNAPGTYEYRCGVHGDSMSGKIVVQ